MNAKTLNKKSITSWAKFMTLLLVATTFQFINSDSQTPARAAQEDLVASVAAPGEMFPPNSFTDLITETFTNVNNLNQGTPLSIGTIRSLPNQTVTAQSGGTNANPVNTDYSLTGTQTNIFGAGWFGGSGGAGTFASIGSSSSTLTHVGGIAIELLDIPGTTDDTYRYVGFWWSGGNSPNIVRLVNNGQVTASFTTASLIAQLGNPPNTRTSDDYFGNPSSQFNSDDLPCPADNTCGDPGNAEPYAYIHLRISTGFDEIQFIGRGFEFDTIAIRRFVPATSDGESSIVGSGVVSSCAAFSDEDAQYVLRNGSFEDDYFTTTGTSETATIASLQDQTSDSTSDRARWVRYISPGPYQFMTLNDADSGLENRIAFWKTTASDGLVELQRQVSGFASSASNNGSQYWDNSGPRPAHGLVHAEINAEETAALFQDIRTIGGQRITWSIKHRGRFFGSTATSSESSNATNNRDKFEIRIGPEGGTLTAQTPAREIRPGEVWNTLDATYSSSATTFVTRSSGHTASTMYTRLEDGWILYTGTYTVPAGQTSTRFQFESRGSSGTLGNLIDDIGFDPIIACPRNVTIQRSQTASYSVSPLLNSQIPNYEYPDTTSVSEVSINGGDGQATLNSNTGDITLSSDTVGSFQVLYTLTDVNNQTSTSTITVNVEDATSQLPNVLLVDPRATTLALPSQMIEGSTNAMLCVEEVANASGDVIRQTPTLEFNRSTPASGDTSRTSFDEVTAETDQTVSDDTTRTVWRFTGPSDDVQAEIPFINIIGAGGSAIAPSGSKYFRMGLTAAAELGSSACFVGGQTFVVEIRSLALRAVVARRIDISD
jgi:hypothetical protein